MDTDVIGRPIGTWEKHGHGRHLMSYRHVGNIIMDTHVINFDALQARGKNMDTDVI